MAEEQLFFQCGDLRIEGLLHLAEGIEGVVITHPHPLYGGSMYNEVVESLARVYQHMGYRTLRFNFRGVGMSQGEHDHGQGEQEDLKSALQFLDARGKTSVDLAGYSFGAWVMSLAVPMIETFQRMILVSPPVAFLDFRNVEFTPRLKLVIAGSRDQIAPPTHIRALLSTWNPDARFEVIQGADHFYWGYIDSLEAVLAEYMEADRS